MRSERARRGKVVCSESKDTKGRIERRACVSKDHTGVRGRSQGKTGGVKTEHGDQEAKKKKEEKIEKKKDITRNGLPVSLHPALAAEERNTFGNLSAPTQSGITPIHAQCQPAARLRRAGPAAITYIRSIQCIWLCIGVIRTLTHAEACASSQVTL